MSVNTIKNIELLNNDINSVNNDISNLRQINFTGVSDTTAIKESYSKNNQLTNALSNKLLSISNTMQDLTPSFDNMKNNIAVNNSKYTELSDILTTKRDIRTAMVTKSQLDNNLNLQINDGIEDSAITYKTNYSTYLTYLFFTVIILVGMIIMFWFPQKGNLDIFILVLSISIIAYLYMKNNIKI